MPLPDEPVTLENCDREPIHIPGSIQPHGALLALDRLGRITHASVNASAMLGRAFVPGAQLRADAFRDGEEARPEVYTAISAALRGERAARSFAARLNGADFDVVLHRDGDELICEFERRESRADVSSFAQIALRIARGVEAGRRRAGAS